MEILKDMTISEKIAFWIFVLCLIALISVFVYPMVSSADANKWNYCNALNVSGADCDDTWTNFTAQFIKNESIFYNRTEIDALLSNYYKKSETYNRTENIQQNINSSDFATKTEINELKTAQINLRDLILTNYTRRDEVAMYMDSNSETSSSNNTPLYLMFGGMVALIVVLVWLGNQNKRKDLETIAEKKIPPRPIKKAKQVQTQQTQSTKQQNREVEEETEVQDTEQES